MVDTVLVTGGAGFIGSHLVDGLVNEGFDVVVLDDFSGGSRDNLSSHLGEPNFRLVEGDVRNEADVKRALESVDAVFHLAASVSVDLSVKNPRLVNEVNVGGTLNVLRESLKAGVERFVYASSCAVYGEPVHLPIDEDYPTKPTSPYGVSKLAAEQYCRVFYEVYGLETVCLRFFNVYGPRQVVGPYSAVIMRFINRLRLGEPPVIYGDGEQTRDFVYVKDVVEGNMHVLGCRYCAGEIVNIGTGKPTTINELTAALINLSGKGDVEPVHVDPRKGDIRNSHADISKAREMLGYSPKVSLEEGLQKLTHSILKRR